jgi:hypothetical protein
MESKKKIQYFFIVVMLIPVIFLFFNFFWRIYLYRIDASLSLKSTADFIIITLILSIAFLIIPGLLIDKKLSPSNEDAEMIKLKIKDFSKIQKKGAILGLIGGIIFGISIFIGESLLLYFGANIFTNIFITIVYVGIALVITGIILIFK